MKKVSPKILSMLLAFVMLLCIAPAAMAENTMPEDYLNVIFFEDFEDGYDETCFHQSTANGLIPVVADATAGSDGKYFSANVKYAEERADYNQYFRIRYDVTNGILDQFVAKHNYTLENLERTQVSMDICFTDMKMSQAIRFFDKFSSTTTLGSSLIAFDTNGDILALDSRMSGSTNAQIKVGTYQTNDWMRLDFFFDFSKDAPVWKLYLDGTLLIESTGFNDDNSNYAIKCIEGFGLASTSKNITEDYAGVHIDNMRMAVNEDFNSGYTSDIVNFDFETWETISATTTDREKNVGNYYLRAYDDNTVTVTQEEDPIRGKVIKVTGGAPSKENTGFGFNSTATSGYSYYTENSKHPELVKFEVSLMKKSSSGAYIKANGGQRLLLWSSSGELRFYHNNNQYTALRTSTDWGIWHTIELYFDFANDTYYIYVNDAYLGALNIPDAISNIEYIWMPAQTEIYLDDMKLTTLPAYADDVISEYTDRLENKKLAFLAKNEEATEKAYKILVAKYTAAGVLDSVTTSDGSVAARTTGLEELPYPTITSDGSYYKYFVWDSMSNIVPLVEEKEIR